MNPQQRIPVTAPNAVAAPAAAAAATANAANRRMASAMNADAARSRRRRGGALAAGIALLVAASPAAADDYAADPSPRQQAVLEALRAAADGPVEARFRPDGTLRYLGGRNVAPGCKAQAPVDAESAAALAACFFDRFGEVLAAEVEPGEIPAWQPLLFAPANDEGFALLRIQQFHGGLPVANATLTFNLRHGDAVSVVGRLYRRQDLTVLTEDLPALEVVRAAAEAASGRALSFLKRLYDPDRRTVVSLFVDRASAAELVAFDDLAMALVGVFLPQSDLNHVQKFADVARYDQAFGGGDKWGRQLAPAFTGEVMVHWEHFTSNFCKAFLDWGSDDEDGEPKVHDLDGSQPGAPGVLAERTQTCDSNGTFPGYPDGGHPAPGQWVNAYFWMHDLAEYARHPDTGYKAAYPWTAPESLMVIASTGNPCFGDPPACFQYEFGVDFDGDLFTEYRVILPVPAAGGEVAASNRLASMAHEHGHFIHNMYDRHYLGIWEDFPENSLNEGFADHNILRYALHRHFQWADRPHDMNFMTTYEEDHWGGGDREHRVTGFFSNGERVPAPPAGLSAGAADWRSMVFAPWDSGTSCHPASGDDFYTCGSLVGRVFWTLAWNRIRVAFNGIAEGTTILQGAGGDDRARRIVSEAYTYAIRAASDGGELDDFFNLVSEYYWQLGQDGTLSGDDVHRVNQALTVHCVGWSSGTCRDWHRTVWQRLPVALTHKATFAETGTEEYLRADEQMDHWSVDTLDFGTPDGAGFVRIEPDPYTGIGAFLDFPADGCYRVHAAARSQTSGARLWVNTEEPGSERTWWIADDWLGNWGWLHDGPAFWVAAGNRAFALRGQQGTVDVEAVLVRLMPGVDEAACAAFTPPPPVPASLTVTPTQCFGGVDLSWGSSPAATSYELQVDTGSAFPSPSTIYSGPDTQFNYSLGTTTRWFRVRACRGSVCSLYRNGDAGAPYIPTCH